LKENINMASVETISRASVSGLGLPFRNEPLTDFSDPGNVRRLCDALAKVRAELGQEYEAVIGKRRVKTGKRFNSLNPARPSQVIGIVHDAESQHADLAAKAATRAFVRWRWSPVDERSSLLETVAAILRKRKYEFCAWIIYEVGKNWTEADAEVAEAIDFAEYYAQQARRLDKAKTELQFPGERDFYRYLPLGVGAVIAPWNFPCAILAGMTLAAVVCGNTVVVKPSPNSPVIAAKFMEVLQEAGVPAGVVNLCPSSSCGVGPSLVEHHQTRFIAFTGSKDAGLDVNLRAAMPRTGQPWIKRTILEMGGKNSIIVDADADLDAAVEGVIQSAFGFAGQKCSACSRVIVDEKVYGEFLERVKDRVSTITLGEAIDNKAMGPVISDNQYKKILEYIEIGKKEGRLITGGTAATDIGTGYFIQPTVLADVAPDARIAQEEIFGPVLAVMKSRHFKESLQIANKTEFGLTGAVYSNSPEKLELAKTRFHVGNLYFNRKCTGAMVGAHPFGGFNMSGTDSKAGGPDYLLLFSQAKTIAERLVES
jgi:1-pyrroline-5-carboxylate dehydrogenase